MAKILRIDSSARFEGSHTRELGDFFLKERLSAHPGDEVVVRDLAREPVPQVDALTLQAFTTAEAERTPAMKAAAALSDRLIEELEAADMLLLTVPMYNFGIPAALKAYVDQIVRSGRTFVADENGVRGLLGNKKTVVITARGAVFIDTPMAGYDQQVPYLRTLWGFLGITDISFVHAEGMTMAPEKVQATLAAARRELAALAAAD